MTTGVIATIPKFQFSANGVPMVLGTLTVYLAGTTTPTDTWQDQALTTLNTNPVVLDSRGECVLWLDSTKSYKFVLKNAGGVIQWTQDNITGADSLLRVNLAASGGSALVGYLPAGTGAVATTVQAELRNVIHTTGYSTVQAAVNAAISQNKALKIVGSVVTAELLIAAGNLSIIGDGREQSSLKFTGTGTFITQTAGDLLSFSRVKISGDGSTAGPIAVAGSVAFRAFNNSTSDECDFIFWETLSIWQGGYYHKHFNSFFRYTKYLFTDWDQNNLAFFGCSVSNIQRGISVASGEGPITFVGGSIEYIADKFIESTVNRGACAAFFGCYMEQGVGVVPPTGITSTTGFYDHGVLVYTNGTEVYPCTFIGNTIYTAGWFRFFWSDSAGGCNVISKGNTLIARGLTAPSGMYVLGGTKVVAELNDTIVGTLTGGLPVYVSGYPTDLEGCQIYDPIAQQWLRPTSQGWTNATLVNSFANDGGTFANVSYFLAPSGKVKLRGALDGTAATAATAFTLPAGYRPSTVKIFAVPSAWGAGSTIQILIYPSGLVILNGTAPFTRQLGLDGIEFYINE